MIPHALSGLGFVERFYSFPSQISTNKIAQDFQKKPDGNKIIVIQSDNHPLGFSYCSSTLITCGTLSASIISPLQNHTIFFHNRALTLAIISSIQHNFKNAPLYISWPDKIYWLKKEICQLNDARNDVHEDIHVFGFSLYVNVKRDYFLQESEKNKTSLQIETSSQFPLSNLLFNILQNYRKNLDISSHQIHGRYLKLLYQKDSKIEINGICGIVESVEEDGRLRISQSESTFFIEDKEARITA